MSVLGNRKLHSDRGYKENEDTRLESLSDAAQPRSAISLKRSSKMKNAAWIGAVAVLTTPFFGVEAEPHFTPEHDTQRVFGPPRRPHASSKPNIVFILTDDQDLHMNSLDYSPLIKKHLIDQGTLYKKHFCTTAICCPARVSILTGKLSHNTNVTDVSPPYGKLPM